MPRRSRSIVLVLIGAGLAVPGCDDRRGRQPTTTSAGQGYPAEPDDVMPAPPPYGYGPMYHAGHPTLGWWAATMFNGRRGYAWDGGYPWAWRRTWTGGGYARTGYRGYRSSSFGPSASRAFSRSRSGSSGSSSHSGSSFGGFGSHATGSASS